MHPLQAPHNYTREIRVFSRKTSSKTGPAQTEAMWSLVRTSPAPTATHFKASWITDD